VFFDTVSIFLPVFLLNWRQNIDQKRDVPPCAAGARDRDRKNIQPVEQVFPEPALPDLFLQVPLVDATIRTSTLMVWGRQPARTRRPG